MKEEKAIIYRQFILWCRYAFATDGNAGSYFTILRWERRRLNIYKTGDVIGKYEIERVIGKGGMGTVYRVLDQNLQMPRAMKELLYHNEKESAWKRKSLEAEICVLKQTDHPMLPKIIDLFHMPDASYLIMEYIEGMTLEEYIKENQKAAEEDAVKWGIQLADVLSYLHRLKPPVLYLDMKPSNIILRSDGVLKLIDFGAALTDWRGMEQGQYMGTPGYAPPEQIQGGSVDMRTDVYALGATLYHLVTGVSPALQNCSVRTVREWDITLSAGLERVISKAAALNPKERYWDAGRMKQELEHVDAPTRRRRRNFIIEYKKNLLYTEKATTGLYPYVQK